VWSSFTGPIPVRIIDAFRRASNQESPAQKWYPKIPNPSETPMMPRASARLRSIRTTKTFLGGNGFVRCADIMDDHHRKPSFAFRKTLLTRCLNGGKNLRLEEPFHRYLQPFHPHFRLRQTA
jgi:hypothetical protein